MGVEVKLSASDAALEHRRQDLYETAVRSYDTCMATFQISAARDDLSAAVTLARTEAVILERYGKPAAVIISPERHDELLAAFEDAQDIIAFDEAMAEEGPSLPWEQVKADLGWS